MKVELITLNKYSRPGKKFHPKGIAMHWMGDPGATAQQCRNYFDSLKGGGRYASAHYCIDAKEAIQCVPLDEMAYHVGSHNYTGLAKKRYAPYPNSFLIGLELSHQDMTGEFESGTLRNAKIVCANLCERFDFNPTEDIVRHFDITGKFCPKWFVHNTYEWDLFQLSVKEEWIAKYERIPR